MRTTLDLDPDVLAAARALARARGRSIGSVVSELARTGLRPVVPRRKRAGFPLFDVPRDAPPLTDEAVTAVLDEA